MAKIRRTGGKSKGSSRARSSRSKPARLPGSLRSGPKLPNLDDLIAEATVDCHDMDEGLMGFASAIEDHLDLPFETEVLGVTVRVERVEETDAARLVAVCTRQRLRQRIPLEELPLPSPPPRGHEWIAAYRRWISGV